MKHIIDPDLCNDGGSAEFYSIIGNPKIGFKQFRSKKWANDAYQKQKLLSKLGLAPKIYGGICKLQFDPSHIVGLWTNWGYVTEKAKLFDAKIMSKKLKDIQTLVNSIYSKTGLKFWDCHYYNVGYIKRQNKKKLVCIDTGKESFDPECNAWGFGFPGPKCNYCERYRCICTDNFWSD